MSPRSNHRVIFLSAIFLLVVCGAAAIWTFYRIYSGENWVRHTYTVQVMVGEIESDLAKTGRARQVYLQTGDEQYLHDIEQTRKELFGEINELKALVSDNSDQQRAIETLEQAVHGRFHILDESVQLAMSGKSTHEEQDVYQTELVRWSRKTSEIAEEIRDSESRLLDRRLVLTNSLFIWIIAIFAATFILSLYMLWEHYRGLNRELAQRKLAEQKAQNLSALLLSAQDQERRKIARDLHDGLGQTLAAAKMIADTLVNRPPERQSLLDLRGILDEAVSSTRSMSHLLYSPLVDEIGFISAARPYLEGFSRRTGVNVSFDLPEGEDRLPRDLELTLFRVLQEALTNIQRHSKSTKAEVHFRANTKTATLKVRDHGVGLPPEMMQQFNENGTNVGVGLAGMKERIRERNGEFEIRSDSTGTLISATFPVVPDSPASA